MGKRTAGVSFVILACSTLWGQVKWTHNIDDGIKGPYVWGTIEGYTTCGTLTFPGNRQSPIDINSKTAQPVKEQPVFYYLPIPMNVINTGHSIQVPVTTVRGGVTIVRGNVREHFNLVELHLHAPAEHTVDGEKPVAMEIHVVHESGDRSRRVAVAIRLVQIDGETPTLDRIIRKAQGTNEKGHIDLKSFFPEGGMYFSYDGSLTTPACDTNVRFLVAKSTQDVSKWAVDSMHEIIAKFPGYQNYRDNNRPLQPLGTRQVLLIGPSRLGNSSK
jgi:carbonic anhydrase